MPKPTETKIPHVTLDDGRKLYLTDRPHDREQESDLRCEPYLRIIYKTKIGNTPVVADEPLAGADEVSGENATALFNTLRTHESEREKLQAKVEEMEENEREEAAIMKANGVSYSCYFWDGWMKVLDERDDLRAEVAALRAKAESK